MSATSTTLRALILRALRERSPELTSAHLATRTKHELLDMLAHTAGLCGVFGAGSALSELPEHPVLAAVCHVSKPHEVMQRWMRLERYGHATHRTRLLGYTDHALTLEHISLDGAKISAPQDIFIWGVLHGLFERASRRVRAVGAGEGAPWLARDGTWREPEATHIAHFLFDETHHTKMESHEAPTEGIVRQVHEALSRDLLATWKLEQLARALHTSTRQLQRALRAEGTTFSGEVHRARLEAACQMIARDELSLTEIAFCAGFADSAHFTRTFRRCMDVPPTAYRETLRMARSQDH